VEDINKMWINCGKSTKQSQNDKNLRKVNDQSTKLAYDFKLFYVEQKSETAPTLKKNDEFHVEH